MCLYNVIDVCFFFFFCFVFFLQAEDGIRDLVRSRGLGDVYKRQVDAAVVADPVVALERDERLAGFGLDKPEIAHSRQRVENIAVEQLSLIHI